MHIAIKHLYKMAFFKFFDTAPKTKSKKVTDLEKAGKTDLLLDAIEAERQVKKGGKPDDRNGETTITVKRVGVHS